MVLGGPGDDRIFGRDDDDKLLGGPGNDEIDGGNGVDSLKGGPGSNDCSNGETVSGCSSAPMGEQGGPLAVWEQGRDGRRRSP